MHILVRQLIIASPVLFVLGCGTPSSAVKEPEIAPCDYARAMSGSLRMSAAVFPVNLPANATEAQREAATKKEILASLERVRGLSTLLNVSEKPSGVLTPELRDLAKAYLFLVERKADDSATPEEIEAARKDLEATHYTYISAVRAECIPDP